MDAATKHRRLKDFSADEDWDFYLNTENEGVPAHPDFVLEKKRHLTSGDGNGLFEPLEFMNLLQKQFLFFNGNVAKPHATIAALNEIPLSVGQKRELFGSIIKIHGWKPDNPDNHLQHGIALGLLNRELSRLSSPYPASEPIAYQYGMEDVAGCAAENDLDYYFNRTNIDKHEFVLDAIAYFETGERKGYIEPLAFLNLLWKQYRFVNDNTGRPHTVITDIQRLPINGELRHVLLAFILKWFGCRHSPAFNHTTQYNTVLKLIEEEFLGYGAHTPEKRNYQPPEPEPEIAGEKSKTTESVRQNSISEKAETPARKGRGKSPAAAQKRLAVLQLYNQLHEIEGMDKNKAKSRIERETKYNRSTINKILKKEEA